MRNHFKTKTYDFTKNQYAKAKQATYDKRKDKYFFIKLSRKYDEEELSRFYLANFVEENSEWIGSMTAHGERNYLDYIRKLQSLSYIFKSDAETMKESCDNFNDLSKVKYFSKIIIHENKDERTRRRRMIFTGNEEFANNSTNSNSIT